jgi:hypothetical protein
MAKTTPILGIQIPDLEESPNIESVHTMAEAFEKYTVMRFATTGNRSTAIDSPTAGMVSYITGTGNLEVYDGSSWVVAAKTGAWSTFTPSMHGTGATGPGSGTIAGRWRQIGKTVDLVIQLILAADTAFGTGSSFSFGSLPVNARATDSAAWKGWGYDSDVQKTYPLSALFEGTTNVRPLSQDGNVQGLAATPFFWGAGDVMVLQGRYEVS